jgi:ParB family chromosome partitioning protein
MELEFHQLDRCWEHLRVRHQTRQRRLLASLAESGQQTPIVVVAAEGQADRYVVIDGYKQIAALEQLGRDTVEAVVWPMSEPTAVVLDRWLRLSEHETTLEVGWLLAELEQRFGYGLDELARRFDRSVSWVSRRLALVEVLPEAIQQQVREGKVLAEVAPTVSDSQLASAAPRPRKRGRASGFVLAGDGRLRCACECPAPAPERKRLQCHSDCPRPGQPRAG